MDILVTWLSYLGLEKAKSGGDTHVIELSKKGASAGHRVIMLTSNTGRLLLNMERTLLDFHQINIPFESFLLKKGLGVVILYVLRPLRTLFIKLNRQFDVIIASSHYPPDILSAFFLHLRNPKSKIVVYCHGILVPPEHGLSLRTLSTVFNYFGIFLIRKIGNLIFVVNKPARALLLCLGVKSNKTVLTDNGVSILDVNPLSIRAKSFDACFLSRLTKTKGAFDLVEVWKYVTKTKSSAKLAVIGDGFEKQHVNELIVKDDLKHNITLFGFLSENKKHEILLSSKIFVFPSYQESWGIVIAEAMAFGLPVVAYDLPVYSEIFEDKLVTVPLGDMNAMAKQVMFLLENPDVARKIGEAGREFVKRYDWNIVAEMELSEIIGLMGRAYGR